MWRAHFEVQVWMDGWMDGGVYVLDRRGSTFEEEGGCERERESCLPFLAGVGRNGKERASKRMMMDII